MKLAGLSSKSKSSLVVWYHLSLLWLRVSILFWYLYEIFCLKIPNLSRKLTRSFIYIVSLTYTSSDWLSILTNPNPSMLLSSTSPYTPLWCFSQPLSCPFCTPIGPLHIRSAAASMAALWFHPSLCSCVAPWLLWAPFCPVTPPKWPSVILSVTTKSTLAEFFTRLLLAASGDILQW